MGIFAKTLEHMCAKVKKISKETNTDDCLLSDNNGCLRPACPVLENVF